MEHQMVFQRYEQKYLITYQQKQMLLNAMEPYMSIDQYGRTTIYNLYLDTEDYRLIRHSIERPVYKEKIRIRTYKHGSPPESVFIELKRKHKSVVYKRRMELSEGQALDFLFGSGKLPDDTQIAREIAYFRDYYKTLRPVVFLAYEREAYYSLAEGDLRITFDENVRTRTTDLAILGDDRGDFILDKNLLIMEIKSSEGLPLWLSRLLSEEKIFRRAFSKYGEAYRQFIFQRVDGGFCYV